MPAENALLLPGMMCDARLWAPQIERLGIPTTVPTLDGADSITSLASQVLDAAPPSFALAGLSMGGYIAFEFCRRNPERVRALVLADTRAHADPPEVLAVNHLDDSSSASATIVGRELILRGERHLYAIAEE